MSAMVLAASFSSVATDIARSIREGLFMFLDTMWALVLGFGLSGAVQAFVPRTSMERRLGNHGPLSVMRASLYGMASSSCSYAASAMAKSLFQKGADFVTSMVFMFASTNLVIELGLVLVVLIGWQFMAAEFVGGAIMVALLAVTGGVLMRGSAFSEARRRVAATAAHGGGSRVDSDSFPLRVRLRSTTAWAEAARFAIADLRMLHREMVIGYGVAGFLAVLVPTHVWSDLFIQGHGSATTLENVLVGPLIAIISFVCSIGNVPLAAALWKGGISFGGVVSFIFADLITMPLLLVYKKLYGTGLAIRMLGLFWIVMSAAGLATEGLFRVLDLVPRSRRTTIVATHLAWNATTALDLAFLCVFAALIVLSRRAASADGTGNTAIDPVCGMQVLIVNAPATTEFEHKTVYFCSDRCRERYVAHPERFEQGLAVGKSAPSQTAAVPIELGRRDSGAPPTHSGVDTVAPDSVTGMEIDPVCHMTVDPATAAATRTYRDAPYYFCCEACAVAFEAEPERYVTA